MTEMVTISADELTRIKERARKSARDKSYLQLVIRLMNTVGSASGLNNTVDCMLRGIIDVIGGTNIILYYTIDKDIFSVDVFGSRAKLDQIDDDLVQQVFTSRKVVEIAHDFTDTRMLTPEFTKAYTWIYPLLVGPELVGVLKMESLHMDMGELFKHLPTFFHFAALVLKNNVGVEALHLKTVELEQEVAERQIAQKNLQEQTALLEIKINELREAQEALVRKEKLAILGQLSGSVGHELRNPLGVMSNAVYFLKMVNADADKTVQEYLDIIKNEIDNSLRIITDLLDFARTKAPQIKAVTARELMDESLARCAIPESIDLQTEIPDNFPLLRVDPLQMGQVLQNLIINAVQAMPDGGALCISARQVLNSDSKSNPDKQDKCVNEVIFCGKIAENNFLLTKIQNSKFVDDFIEISVTDTGEGISPENMKKLFQPLFTTKVKGIGLGLVVCKNLVEANGGRIEVESRLGEGTTFSILLKYVQ